MQQSGEFHIGASREAVWNALNDPAVLQRCIEGCEEMQRVDDTHFTASVRARVGPVSAMFAGEVTLTDLDPPSSYTLVGAGKGGAAGFARGEARVRLIASSPAETVLQYDIEAKVGGKLAQIGSRLIDGAARKMADDFFGRFAELLGASNGDSAAPHRLRALEERAGAASTAATAADAADTVVAVPSAAADAAVAMAMAQAAAVRSAGERAFQPSNQRFVWGVVFGIVVLAVLLAAL